MMSVFLPSTEPFAPCKNLAFGSVSPDLYNDIAYVEHRFPRFYVVGSRPLLGECKHPALRSNILYLLFHSTSHRLSPPAVQR